MFDILLDLHLLTFSKGVATNSSEGGIMCFYSIGVEIRDERITTKWNAL